MMKNIFQDLKRKDHKRYLGGLDVFKYIGPGLLVTVGLLIRALGIKFCRRFRVRLFTSLGGHLIHYHVDCPPA